MQQNHSSRFLFILLVLGVSLYLIFPNPKTWFADVPLGQKLGLKPGIDIAGGTKLLYDIKPPEGGSGNYAGNLSEQVMEALKKRVDPQGVRNLIWRPQGSTQLEIQMPRTTDSEVAEQKQEAYLVAQRELEAANVRPGEVLRVIEQTQGEARTTELNRLAAGSTKRQELFNQLASTFDRVAAARQAQDAEAQARAEIEYDKLKTKLPELNVSISEIQSAVDAKGDARDKALAQVREAAKESPTLAAAVDKYIASYDEYTKVKSTIGDVAELKRLLRGSGVLDWHILVSDLGSAEAQRMIQRLDGRDATRIQANDTMAWFEVDQPEQFGGYQTFPYNGKQYALAWITPEKSMTQREGQSNWALERAYPTMDEMGGRAVGFRFNPEGAALFDKLTSNNLQEPLAALLDGKIISAANINSRIGRSGIITRGGGGYSNDEFRYLISTLNAGSLPAQLAEDPIREQTVGPQLGQDNLRRGLWACVFGLIVVAGFLIGYYYLAGVVATLAVLMNVVIILGVMSMFNATFTLPGIAGIVLTVGMAVDANVLIFERLREEQIRGAGLKVALRNAYDRAFSAILDSNVTTGITAAVLYMFGSEEVKGFGLTLMIGIAASLFTALFVTRTIFNFLMDRGVDRLGSLPLTYPKWDEALRPNIDWMSKAWIFYTISGVFILGGLIAFVAKLSQGQMLDIEFAKGTSVQVDLKQPTDIEEVRRLIEAQNDDMLPAPSVVAVGTDGLSYEIVTPLDNRNVVTQAVTQALGDKLRTTVPSTFDNSRANVDAAITGRAIIPVENADLTVAGFRPEDASAHVGGAAIVLNNLQPELSASEIRQRIEQQRLTTGGSGYRDFAVNTPGTPDEAVSTAVVLVSDPSITYTADPDKWEDFVAAPMWQMINSAITDPPTLQKVSSFGPQIAAEARFDAMWAMVLSIIVIVMYIWVRFGNLKYGTATVVALLHDTLFTVAAIGFSHYLADTFIGRAILVEPFRINLTMVAALLTVMGYSMNDTVVVFDRIRENRGKLGHLNRRIINDSINQTLSRTLLTGGTTIITIFVMYLFGGAGIHGFTFALLVGILVGTYSSIAIASPILLLGGEPETATTGNKAAIGQLQRA